MKFTLSTTCFFFMSLLCWRPSGVAAALLAAVASTQGSSQINPLGKVMDLLEHLAATIREDDESAERDYQRYFEWCDDSSATLRNQVHTATMSKAKLEAKIVKESSNIEECDTKIEGLVKSIASTDQQLSDAGGIRKKDSTDFQANEEELMTIMSTLERAIGILEREVQKTPAAMAQISSMSMANALRSLSALADAAALSGADQSRLTALLQANDGADEMEFGSDLNAPAAAVYADHTQNIFAALQDLKDKTEVQLSDLRKSEASEAHNYKMLHQSLSDELVEQEKDLSDEKSNKAEAAEAVANAQGTLKLTNADLIESKQDLATMKQTCMSVAADHEANTAASKAELKTIGDAMKELKITTGGAEKETYSLMQVSSTRSADARTSAHEARVKKTVELVRKLSKSQHSIALAQLAKRVSDAARYREGGSDPFKNVKKLVQDMLAKLEGQATREATEKAFCDSEMGKTSSKKDELDEDMAKMASKTSLAQAKSGELKEHVKTQQAELAALYKAARQRDEIRRLRHAEYLKAKAALEQGLQGLRNAIEVLRSYYSNPEDGQGDASLLQGADSLYNDMTKAPSQPVTFKKASGAGSSIIGLLEVVYNDFATSLAKEEAEESDALNSYEQWSHRYEVTRATVNTDVSLSTQAYTGLDKTITEISGDSDTMSTQLQAVNEYYGKLRQRCVAKPEVYEARKQRRDAEMAGLQEALDALGVNGEAFLQKLRGGA